jgi:predicted protein tyrosine phosphatase
MSITEKPNILVVCGRNKRRSRTAEYVFKNDRRFNIRSVGLSPKSEQQIKEKYIEWADLIFVTERSQSSRLSKTYRHLELPRIETLHIPDEYEYLDKGLIELLTERMNLTMKETYEL